MSLKDEYLEERMSPSTHDLPLYAYLVLTLGEQFQKKQQKFSCEENETDNSYGILTALWKLTVFRRQAAWKLSQNIINNKINTDGHFSFGRRRYQCLGLTDASQQKKNRSNNHRDCLVVANPQLNLQLRTKSASWVKTTAHAPLRRRRKKAP